MNHCHHYRYAGAKIWALGIGSRYRRDPKVETQREITRSIKRYTARQIWRTIQAP
jgi:hypothetical protein